MHSSQMLACFYHH